MLTLLKTCQNVSQCSVNYCQHCSAAKEVNLWILTCIKGCERCAQLTHKVLIITNQNILCKVTFLLKVRNEPGLWAIITQKVTLCKCFTYCISKFATAKLKTVNWNVLYRLTVYRELYYRGQPVVFCPHIAQEFWCVCVCVCVCVCKMHLKINAMGANSAPL